ncbi:MAG: TPM domain-containing protein [Bacteroidetes bacterium]|nr:MAG: TPM domain-containing protein [Bacteroidota bacterium]
MKSAKTFFSEIEQQKIIQSIQDAEKETTAEIRVHIENICFGNPLKRAEKIFLQQNMHVTKERNGVLFYMAVWNRKLAIIGDKGIYEKVPPKEWDTLVRQLITSFKNNENKCETLCQCIKTIGQWLTTYFPITHHDNPNELSDEISFS